jgi:GDPmannose 4,6-dehydratase
MREGSCFHASDTETLDWEPLVTTDPAFVRSVDAVELVGDLSRAARLLGWKPQTGFTELVGRMVDADLQRA